MRLAPASRPRLPDSGRRNRIGAARLFSRVSRPNRIELSLNATVMERVRNVISILKAWSTSRLLFSIRFERWAE